MRAESRGVVRSVRGAVLVGILACSAIGCGSDQLDPTAERGGLTIRPSPSPFSHITSGEVRALVPDGWEAVSLDPAIDHRGGFLAAPRLERWARMDGSVAGMSATWVDATRVGVPSDLYYLAATGPLLTRLTHSEDCVAADRSVVLDRRPSFAGLEPSPSDYVARGSGTCSVGKRTTRWAYFVAAPGLGPVRQVGIPSSGLYVVVVVIRDADGARPILRRLVQRAMFGGATVADLLDVARQARPT